MARLQEGLVTQAGGLFRSFYKHVLGTGDIHCHHPGQEAVTFRWQDQPRSELTQDLQS